MRHSITSLMDSLTPILVIETIFIINRIVTIAHEHALSAISLSDALTLAGYEVFDIVPDSASSEKLPGQADPNGRLEQVVQRWDPRQHTQVDGSTRLIHDAICQLCTAYSDLAIWREALDSVAISGVADAIPLYLVTLLTDGMTCSSCVGNVTTALQDVRTVDRADVSLISRSANVRLRFSS